MARKSSSFSAIKELETKAGKVRIASLKRLESRGVTDLDRLPFTIRVLLENVLRHCGNGIVTEEDVEALAGWTPGGRDSHEIPFMPARVILQDFTGVPCVVDLAAMRDAMAAMGGNPARINPQVPADLVIDHSVQVDQFGTAFAMAYNIEKEYERNHERYALLRWAQQAFQNFRVVPPGTGIVHQVNLEYLARVVQTVKVGREKFAFPDTLVGTDSHTTMINGLGVLGWGVGGIEAEAVMLGQPYFMLLPDVVGFKLTGELPEGSTATDLVLTVTQMLRKRGVVDKLVEFHGPGLAHLGLADRATIANMSPEYGATAGFFPVDRETLRYLKATARDAKLVDLVERYCREQRLFHSEGGTEPDYSDRLELDLGKVEPSMAGPRRPQDRVALRDVRENFGKALIETFGKKREEPLEAAKMESEGNGIALLQKPKAGMTHGAVVIAAITSCTNTSNPSVMIGAGLLAKKAVERGLKVQPWVKTSLAPGSRVVTDYLEAAGLMSYLDALQFHVVGYGCTTCIGNSGTLPPKIADEVTKRDLVVAAVLSGNRNFEGRINPLVKASYLASPMLVVAYALAGTVETDLQSDPLGTDPNGEPVYLRDLWPSQEEIREAIEKAVKPEQFKKQYGRVFDGDEKWRGLPVPKGGIYAWSDESTYVQNPPYFEGMPAEPSPLKDIAGARVLALLGDSITTDHISPAGAISLGTPAAAYLAGHGVTHGDFNTYGSRRGNHEVMIRGTFANIRLRNRLAPDTEGGWTVYVPTGEKATIYDASQRYQKAGIPLLVIGGKEYGTGSSRDWAAKGTTLLGVRAVIAESFERIHRSNLIGMGVLPMQFKPGENAASIGLTGREEFRVEGIANGLKPRKELRVVAKSADEKEIRFGVIARVDSEIEIEYYRHGGILPYVLRKLLKG